MASFSKARIYLRRNPGEALTDLAGCALICGLIVVGFSIPSVL